MVSYKKIMRTALIKKTPRALLSSFSTFRTSPQASLPFKLKMECSSICNLRCTMCPLHTGLNRKQGFLKFNKFKFVFDQINPAYLNLTGIGEPLMNNDLMKIVKYAKKKNSMVKLDTNGMLLTDKNIKKIIETKIDIISISIDGTDKDSYESIRIGSNFEMVKKNVKNLVKYRNYKNSSVQVHMFFVLQIKNLEKLPKFIKLGEELGVDYMAGGFVVPLGKNENKKNDLIKTKINSEKIIKETEDLIKKSKIEISLNSLLDYLKSEGKKEFYNEKTPCYMPWYSTFITWDGFVNPCDFSCDNEIVFGNVFEEPFKKIWNNNKIQNFRKGLLEKRSSIGICKSCSVDETYILNEFKKIKKLPLMGWIKWKE